MDGAGPRKIARETRWAAEPADRLLDGKRNNRGLGLLIENGQNQVANCAYPDHEHIKVLKDAYARAPAGCSGRGL